METTMPPLNRFEQIAYRMICEAAENGQPCPANLDIEIALGCNSTSVAPVVVSKLEEKGYITVIRYQRAREVTITATGQSTAPHPQRRTSRKHVPRGSGSAVGKLAKISRGMQ
jgi:Mn-dependent DtxR family transcriptional regulator